MPMTQSKQLYKQQQKTHFFSINFILCCLGICSCSQMHANGILIQSVYGKNRIHMQKNPSFCDLFFFSFLKFFNFKTIKFSIVIIILKKLFAKGANLQNFYMKEHPTKHCIIWKLILLTDWAFICMCGYPSSTQRKHLI